VTVLMEVPRVLRSIEGAQMEANMVKQTKNKPNKPTKPTDVNQWLAGLRLKL